MSQSECSDCSRVCLTSEALHAHCQDKKDHSYSEGCEKIVIDFVALLQHPRDSTLHQEDWYTSSDETEAEAGSGEDGKSFCDACNRPFVDKHSLYQHLATSSKHNWCFVCSRDFVNEKALEQHSSSSRVHHLRGIFCPLCSKAFKISSSIAQHIESGACHNITRHQVTEAVHSLKIKPPVSISRSLDAPPASAKRSIIHYSATEKAFNGSAYECYICHRAFREMVSLNAHLASPAHDKDEFLCPKCKRTYKLISGLMQHIESEVCGVAKFKRVEKNMNNLTGRFSRLLKI